MEKHGDGKAVKGQFGIETFPRTSTKPILSIHRVPELERRTAGPTMVKDNQLAIAEILYVHTNGTESLIRYLVGQAGAVAA
jgi:hypothetical protein